MLPAEHRLWEENIHQALISILIPDSTPAALTRLLGSSFGGDAKGEFAFNDQISFLWAACTSILYRVFLELWSKRSQSWDCLIQMGPWFNSGEIVEISSITVNRNVSQAYLHRRAFTQMRREWVGASMWLISWQRTLGPQLTPCII